MSLRRPTPREYAILGGINVVVVGVVLWLGHTWMAAYFSLLAAAAFWSARRPAG